MTLAVSGTDLYAGGYFTTAGGTSANYIAKWNGTSWSTLSSGLDNVVFALEFDGQGNLLVGGFFTQVCGNAACNSGNTTVNRIARWDETSWSAVGFGFDNTVSALAVDVQGNVYAGGTFSQVCSTAACTTGSTVNFVARWDGIRWSSTW